MGPYENVHVYLLDPSRCYMPELLEGTAGEPINICNSDNELNWWSCRFDETKTTEVLPTMN